MLTARDSAINAAMFERANAGKAGYVTQGYRVRTVPTPELNMLFPRMTGTSPFDLDSYASWVGMDTSTMERVNVTEAFRRRRQTGDKDGRRRPQKESGIVAPLRCCRTWNGWCRIR